MEIKTIHCTLICKKDEPGDYSVLVFQNIDVENDYVMCTKLPNWEVPVPEIGEVGFMQYREFLGGKDQWYDRDTETLTFYNYTGLYFWDFVTDNTEQSDHIIFN